MISFAKTDPRTKLVIVLVLSTIALIHDDIFMLFVILGVSSVISVVMRSNLISIFFGIKRLLVVMIAIAFIQSLFTGTGNPLFKLGDIVLLTDYGLIKSLEFILRFAVMIVSAAIITTSTSREIIQGLVQWHCPYEIAFMVSAAIRFLPIFKEEMTDMVTAIQLRGIDLKRIKLKQKLKVYKYILIPIVINSVLKAKELSAAMEMRGFRAYPERTSYMVLKMSKADYIVIGICLASLIYIIVI